MLELNNVGYAYPGADRAALVNVSLQLQQGQCLGLLGANGAGKTTLLSLIAGLLQPGSGQVVRPGQSSIGLVPQTLAFHARLSVQENLELFADLYRLRGLQRQQRLANMIEVTRLGALLKRKAGQLSGGQQRRLNVAIGLLQPADLYLLDEATVGIDSLNRQHVLQAVRELVNNGKTVIYTSHYLPEIGQVADRVLLLAEGRVQLDTCLPMQQPKRLHIRWPAAVPTAIEHFLQRHAACWQPGADGLLQTELVDEASWPALLHLLGQQDSVPVHLEYREPGLEELYLRVSGGRL